MTSDFASPTLARCENTRSASTKARPAARDPLRLKLNTAPHRAAAVAAPLVVRMRCQLRIGDRLDHRVPGQEATTSRVFST